MLKINQTKGFILWFMQLTIKEQTKVAARLERIASYGHFGDAKSIGGGLAELRWQNGWRVYFVKAEKTVIVLLNGGHKNGQKKDIEKARLLLQRYAGD
ncbi:MAG TPA: type II toxin-antitoxin system RelE/ParE family toxin [Candidatus Babeliales bacterium]|nr:type II toxin-antitoxin system RelE/ParE family toxin [Candidatus Babeliales bacterium]